MRDGSVGNTAAPFCLVGSLLLFVIARRPPGPPRESNPNPKIGGRIYQADPDIDFDKEDPAKYHRSWIKSQHGCQYCQLGVKHLFPTTVEELEAERAGGTASTNS